VGPRAALDDVEKRKFLTLPGLELQPVGRPASSKSLCPLSIPAPNKEVNYYHHHHRHRRRRHCLDVINYLVLCSVCVCVCVSRSFLSCKWLSACYVST
jgi:hypothetical protein